MMMQRTRQRESHYTRRTLRRLGVICVGGVVLMSGCHKNQQATYAPPPEIQSAPPPQTVRHTTPTKPTAPKLPLPDANAPVLASETGMASWYGASGRNTANGEAYTSMEMTAAHRTLPLNTILRVTNIATGQSAIVRVNDRGPFVHGRLLDLSIAAARETGVYMKGTAKVRIDVLRWPDNAWKPGHWCVQVGAFQQEHHAIQLKQDLLTSYASSTVIEFPGDTGYWVRYKSQTLDRQNAVQVASSIHTGEPTVDAFLVRLD